MRHDALAESDFRQYQANLAGGEGRLRSNHSALGSPYLWLSDEQKNLIDAPLGAIAVTACAGSDKTSTAIRQISIRQQWKEAVGGSSLCLSRMQL